jgi:signal peptidase II
VQVRKQTWIFIVIAAGLVILDQFIKWLVDAVWITGTSKVVIPKLITFTYSQNTGAAFGMFQGWTLFLILFSVIVIAVITYYYKQIPKKMVPWVALVIGGAVSNLIDRVLLGHVVDYIQIVAWPTFNLADCGITVGTIAFGLWLIRN